MRLLNIKKCSSSLIRTTLSGSIPYSTFQQLKNHNITKCIPQYSQRRFANTISGSDSVDKVVKATITLEDGSVFEGISFGAEKPVNGEVVFSTGMVGYTESLTDPSFRGQVITH
jgi:hypothetical protein